MGTHMPHGITQCYLPLGRGDIPALTPAETGTRFSDPGGMQGWVDLCGDVRRHALPHVNVVLSCGVLCHGASCCGENDEKNPIYAAFCENASLACTRRRWHLLQRYRSTFDMLPYGPLRANVTSFTKPEVYNNVSQRSHRRIEPGNTHRNCWRSHKHTNCKSDGHVYIVRSS